MRLAIDTDMKVIFEVIFKHWKLADSSPLSVLSLVGDDDLKCDGGKSANRNFLNSMVKVLQNNFMLISKKTFFYKKHKIL